MAQSSDCGCPSEKEDSIEIDVSTSGCVNGQINTTFPNPGGGGYTPTSINPQNPGLRTVQGTSTATLTASPTRTTLKVTPGREYSVKYSKVGTSTINSLHTRLEPKNLPPGYRLQTLSPGDTEWKDEPNIDQFGAATNVPETTHKFRVLAPAMPAGAIPAPGLRLSRFQTLPNPTSNGFGVVLAQGPDANVPGFAFPVASLSIPLGSVLENNDRIGAGSLVFKQQITTPLAATTPILLSYQGPATFDAAGNSAHGLVLVRAGNNIRQIKSPEILADITTISGDEFHISLYAPAQIGAQPGTDQPFPLTGQAIASVIVQKSANTLTLTSLKDGQTVNSQNFSGDYINNNVSSYRLTHSNGPETTVTDNNLITYATTGQNTQFELGYPGSLHHTFVFTGLTQPMWTRKETSTTTRDGVTTAKSEKRYLGHSIGGWGGNAQGGIGDTLLDSKDFFGPGANDYHLSGTWYNLHPHPAFNPQTLPGPIPNPAYNATYGKPAFTFTSDGSWTRFQYDSQGRVIKTWKSYRGTPLQPEDSTDANSITETYTYAADPFENTDYGANTAYADAMKNFEAGYEKKHLGITVAKRTNSYSPTSHNGHEVIRRTTLHFSSAADSIQEITDTYRHTAPPHLAGKTRKHTRATGETHSYGYQTGHFDTVTRAFTPDADGLDLLTTATQGTIDYPDGIAQKTTRTLTITSAVGLTHRISTQIFTGGTTYSPATVTDRFYDDHGHLSRTEQDGRILSEEHAHGLTNETEDESGIGRTTVRDNLGRITEESKTGGPATTHTHTGTTTIRTITTPDGNRTTATTVDWLGRVSSATNPGGETTLHTYPARGKQHATTHPGGLVTLATSHPGGESVSETNTTGAKIIPRHHTHTVAANGNRTTRVSLATSGSPRWSETTADWLGRTTSMSSPAPSGTGTVISTIAYNASGLPGSETPDAKTGLKPRLYEYDALGRLYREGIDHNSSGTLDPASADRITEHDHRFEQISGHWYEVRETRQYRADNSGTATTVSVCKTRLHGSADGLAERTIATNADGLTVTTTRTIDRAHKTSVITSNSSDITGTTTMTIVNGLLTEEKSPTAHLTHTYDALERPATTTDMRTGAVTTRAYDPATGQLESITDHLGNTTAHFYHPATHKNAGQIREIRDAAQKSRRFDYNDRGQRTHAWGAAQYPTKTTHTAYGETATLTTYRGGSGWDGTTWPTGSEGTGDLTTWQHFAPTGLLQFKEDAQGRKTQYTYRDNGQIHLRTWQRGVTATHSYDGAGLLSGITYSDTTPPVAITRHRTGEAKTLTDAAGHHTYAYTPAGRTDLETITGTGPHSGITLDHTYAANGIAENLSVTAGATTIYGTSRTFHPASGLLDEVASGNTLAAYRHHPGSALVHQITHKHNGEAALVNSRRYDDLNRLTATTHFATGDLNAEIPMQPLAYTGYQHDALHRRTRATELNGDFWDYGYNDRSEVLSADKKLSDGVPLAGKQYRHVYDNIGNVTAKETGGDATGANRRTFTTPSNSLNQYSGYATPNSFDVMGTSPGTPAVTVNGIAAAYQNDFFRAQITANNANANGEWKAVTVTSGANTQSGFRYIAPASFTPTYDLDGNLTDDGEWNYVWDAENRLKTMTRTARAQAAGAPYRRVEYTYDAQHRCVERREHHAPAGPVVKTERYIYDGWNRIATLDAANQPQQRFTWGTDLSGAMQGAGGVGGLLWIEDVPTSTTHLVCMDGNGNVTTLINATTKQPTARYEYSPFGELIRQSGPYAATNSYRFSTKPQDPTTALLYYGYRWFKPDWNIWASRDPIAENGGVNLYGFALNNAIKFYDYLGGRPGELVLPEGGGAGNPDYQKIAELDYEKWKIRKKEIDAANSQFNDALSNYLFPGNKKNHHYDKYEPWTQELMRRPVYDRMRNFIRSIGIDQCESGNYYSSVGHRGKWDDSADDYGKNTIIYDGINYITKWKLQSLGSNKGTFTITNVDCKNCTISYEMDVSDSFRFGSMTRKPGTDLSFSPQVKIIGASTLNPAGIAMPSIELVNSDSADNPLGKSGAFGNVKVTWAWDETLHFKN
jgi:RHS repeat-associated protein